MITVLLVMVLTIVIGLWVALVQEKEGSILDKLGSGAFLSVLLALLGGVLGLLIAVIVSLFVDTPPNWVEVHTPIVAMRTHGSTSGSFVLGTGKVGTKIVAVYWTEDEHGYKVNQLDEDFYIVEEDREDGLLVAKHDKVQNWWVWYFPATLPSTYTFYVPLGSVIHDYSVR